MAHGTDKCEHTNTTSGGKCEDIPIIGPLGVSHVLRNGLTYNSQVQLNTFFRILENGYIISFVFIHRKTHDSNELAMCFTLVKKNVHHSMGIVNYAKITGPKAIGASIGRLLMDSFVKWTFIIK